MGWVSGTGNTTNRKKLLFCFSTEIYRIQQKCLLNVAEFCWHPLTRKGKQFGFRSSLITAQGFTESDSVQEVVIGHIQVTV